MNIVSRARGLVPVASTVVPTPTRVPKVVAYVVQDGRLLVFRHRDVDLVIAGVQVPAGTIRDGERPEDAVLREAAEETGVTDLRLVRDLGVEDYDVRPGRPEIHERHFFQLATSRTVDDEWLWFEEHDGVGEPTAFLCFWIPLAGHPSRCSSASMSVTNWSGVTGSFGTPL
jgi:8-oxo-dGTP pyrophosphatase MutT (NUDIX family)